MAESTDCEKEIIEKISDSRLRTALLAIREAVEDIWKPEVPRIIEYFTDHGISHCENILEHVSAILNANPGVSLSEEELFLLIAGVYLHDIGMQCDVKEWPQIKERSEEFGARYELDYRTPKGEYSTEEQIDLRKNHHILSAAWIDFAFKHNETRLGEAIKLIPNELVGDLMDVCKFHSKLPITDCALNLFHDPSGRKRLIAALVRISDELDIDNTHVTIATVRDFCFEPQNAVYWWLHHNTNITLRNGQVVHINIALHHKDYAQLRYNVYDAYINAFRTKNRPIFDELRQNGIDITFDGDSEVVESEYADAFPDDIITYLVSMQETADPIKELVNEMRIWLGAIRYEIGNEIYINDRTVEITATLEQGTIRQRVFIWCIAGEISKDDVKAIDLKLDKVTPYGWLISDQRVSQGAYEESADADNIWVYNLAGFLKDRVWGSYINELEALVRKDKIPELYVDFACYKQIHDDEGEMEKEEYNNVDDYLESWLLERGKNHISLLGDFGSGKTWFCRHFAYKKLFNGYLKNPIRERLPLLITLRRFAKAMTAEQLINQVLLEQYNLPFVGGAFELFLALNRRGKLLLILDGFDEMARQVDYDTVIKNFRELANLVNDNSKVILTSRTEFFRGEPEQEKVFSSGTRDSSPIDFTSSAFEIVYLEPFNDEQIREVIRRRRKDGKNDGDTIADLILNDENLAEMAKKPVLIELLLAALDEEVDPSVLKKPAHVYLYATNGLLLRNIETERTFTSTADKLYFLCELAWEMVSSENLRIHFKDIPKRINDFFGDKIDEPGELDNWDFDLRNQTLLHRNSEGYYEFAHKSLAEFFIALKFTAELGCLADEFRSTYKESQTEVCEIPIIEKEFFELRESFGALSFQDPRLSAVLNFMIGMLDIEKVQNLTSVISNTRSMDDKAYYMGGNAATLIGFTAPRIFVSMDISSANLDGAILNGVDLRATNNTETSFLSADLRGSSFNFEDLIQSDIGDSFVSSYILSRFRGDFKKHMFNTLNKLDKLTTKLDLRLFGFYPIAKHQNTVLSVATIQTNDVNQLSELASVAVKRLRIKAFGITTDTIEALINEAPSSIRKAFRDFTEYQNIYKQYSTGERMYRNAIDFFGYTRVLKQKYRLLARKPT